MNETEPSPGQIKTDNKDSKNKIKSKVIIILLILSVALNLFLIISNNERITGAAVNNFKYINPAETIPLDSETQGNELILHYQGLKDKLEKKIAEYGKIEDVGIFVQDVKTGAWLGINEKTYFIPASLFKIPVMMATLKKISRGELSLTDRIVLIPKDLNNASGDLYKNGAGVSIPINQLLKEMVTFSDNTAKNALQRQLKTEEIDSVFSHVGINAYSDSAYNRLVSPRGYIRFFKSLYYSTYLSSELSEYALELTTETEEEGLLPKGIPYEIQVAHKFGYYLQNGQEGIHDCGIVYHPKNPYFMCIMTKDFGVSQSGALIPELSKEIFDYIDSMK